jgi:hypothetical protein
MSKRGRRRMVIDFDRLLLADARLAASDTLWRAQGYQRSSARLWLCRDRTYTARIVWRNRVQLVSTVTYTVQGLVLA